MRSGWTGGPTKHHALIRETSGSSPQTSIVLLPIQSAYLFSPNQIFPLTLIIGYIFAFQVNVLHQKIPIPFMTE